MDREVELELEPGGESGAPEDLKKAEEQAKDNQKNRRGFEG